MESHGLDLVELGKIILDWVIGPVAVFVIFIYREQQRHATDIAVLKANYASVKQAHEREMQEIRETTRAIMVKLDNIEQALRK